jgi:hypothetical protein
VAHVLNVESRPDGLTEVQVSTGATTIIKLLIRTDQWYAMTAEALDSVVRLAVAERRQQVKRR